VLDTPTWRANPDQGVLDRGDAEELATDYVRLNSILPDRRVVGGCCGTDREHVGAISRVLGAR
jgi:methionine synthase I (cobalamin-dependent)